MHFRIHERHYHARVISRDREEQKGWGSRNCMYLAMKTSKTSISLKCKGCRDDNANRSVADLGFCKGGSISRRARVLKPHPIKICARLRSYVCVRTSFAGHLPPPRN